MQNEEANDLIMLAGLVKKDMRQIDSFTMDQSERRSDNINLRNFINLPQPQVSVQPQITPEIQQNTPVFNHILPVVNEKQTSKIEFDHELKTSIDSMKSTLEKINVNLTKLTGMFGKVFHNLTKDNKNG